MGLSLEYEAHRGARATSRSGRKEQVPPVHNQHIHSVSAHLLIIRSHGRADYGGVTPIKASSFAARRSWPPPLSPRSP